MQDMVVASPAAWPTRVGLLNRVEDKLEQADLPLRPPEALFFYVGGRRRRVHRLALLLLGPIGAGR